MMDVLIDSSASIYELYLNKFMVLCLQSVKKIK